MSMGNFITVPNVSTHCMATRDPTVRSPTRPPADGEPGVGIAHLTVVPTNFDPDEPSGRRE